LVSQMHLPEAQTREACSRIPPAHPILLYRCECCAIRTGETSWSYSKCFLVSSPLQRFFTKFAGGKQLVRSHQGQIVVYKICWWKTSCKNTLRIDSSSQNCWWKTSCKNSPRNDSSSQNCWWKTSCKNSPRMDSSSQNCGGKQHGRTHQVYSLAKVFWWKTCKELNKQTKLINCFGL
jgi:hypothetical protein